MAQFAQSSSIHAAFKHYAVDMKRIPEWIQYWKAGKFNGVSSTAARWPGGGADMLSVKKTMMKSTGSPMTPMLRAKNSLATSGVEFSK